MNYADNPEYIEHYFDLGFKKVCRVKSTYRGNEWFYTDMDESLMFSPHRSWVYAITRFERILKFGETGNPLGIKSKRDEQPVCGTHNRLGRYRKGGGSDETIRNMFRKETQDSSGLTIYAAACPEMDHSFTLLNESRTIKSQIHKQLEKFLLDYYKEKVGQYPEGNTGRY